MNRLKVVITAGFAIMFVAGLAVGLTEPVKSLAVLSRTATPSPTTKPDDTHSRPMPPDLHLSPAQDEQIRGIWKEARSQADSESQKFHELDRERDDAITALLSPDQKAQYDRLRHDHESKVSALRLQIHEVMQKAEGKTREILTPEQQAKFDEVLRQRRHMGPPGIAGGPAPAMGMGHRHDHGPHNGPWTAPTGGPETAPSH